MMAKTHLAVGIGSAAVAMVYGLVPMDIIVPLTAGIGSLAPDLDHPYSTFGRMVPFISYPMSAMFGHRGITHSLIAIIALTLLGVQAMGMNELVQSTLIGFVIGYLSHLLIDAFNPAGIPMFYPSYRRYRFPLTFHPGGVLENVFLAAFVAGSAYLTLSRFGYIGG